MSENSALSPRMTALGEALRPILSKLDMQMDAPARRTLAVYDVTGSISDHLDELGSTRGGLVSKVGALDRLISGEGPDADIHHAAGGLEVYIDNLWASCSEVRRWRLGASDVPARDLTVVAAMPGFAIGDSLFGDEECSCPEAPHSGCMDIPPAGPALRPPPLRDLAGDAGLEFPPRFTT